jgi:hypothetical protein
MLQTIRQRLAEPSTWAGIGLCVTLGADAWASRDPQAIGAFVAGLVAILKPERAL